VIADPKTTNTAIFTMLLIADSPGEKPLPAMLSAIFDIIRAYLTNQLARSNRMVNKADGKTQIFLNPHQFARLVREAESNAGIDGPPR